MLKKTSKDYLQKKKQKQKTAGMNHDHHGHYHSKDCENMLMCDECWLKIYIKMKG